MAYITLFDNGLEKLSLNTDEHKVKEPQRALNKFKFCYYKSIISWLFAGIAALITLFTLFVIKPFGIEIIRDFKYIEFNLVSVIIFISIMLLPVYFFVSIYKIIKAIKRLNSPINISTPEETWEVFKLV